MWRDIICNKKQSHPTKSVIMQFDHKTSKYYFQIMKMILMEVTTFHLGHGLVLFKKKMNTKLRLI